MVFKVQGRRVKDFLFKEVIDFSALKMFIMLKIF